MNFEDESSFQLEEFNFLPDFNTNHSRFMDNCEGFLNFDIFLQKKKSSLIQDYLLQEVPVQKSVEQQRIEQEQTFVANTSNVSTSGRSDTSTQSLFRKCSCTRSRCLKNYCECFKLGIKCNEECECRDCRNHVQLFQLPSSITVEKIKCKCKKSKCLKNYCECHSAGKKCGLNCACTDCQNEEEREKQNGEIRKRVKSNPLLQYEQYLN